MLWRWRHANIQMHVIYNMCALMVCLKPLCENALFSQCHSFLLPSLSVGWYYQPVLTVTEMPLMPPPRSVGGMVRRAFAARMMLSVASPDVGEAANSNICSLLSPFLTQNNTPSVRIDLLSTTPNILNSYEYNKITTIKLLVNIIQ